MNMRTLDTLTLTWDTVTELGNWAKAEEVKGMKTVAHTSCRIPTCPPSQPKLSLPLVGRTWVTHPVGKSVTHFDTLNDGFL